MLENMRKKVPNYITVIKSEKKMGLTDFVSRMSVTRNTGLFISPSGTSELDCATTKKDTAERSISIGRESLKVLFYTRGRLGVLAGSTARG